MELTEIKNAVMFQTNNDIEDVSEYSLVLNSYINEGYEKLCFAFWRMYPSPSGLLKPLEKGTDIPKLPTYAHRAISDYSTYLIYRNGNPSKQNRGMAFLQTFNEILIKLQLDNSKLENGGINADGTLVNPDDVVMTNKKHKITNLYPPYRY